MDNSPVNGTDPLGLCWYCIADPWSHANPLYEAAQQGSAISTVIEYADPAYAAIDGYYNEYQDAQNPCSSDWSLAFDAFEGVSGAVGTVGAGAGTVAAIDRLGYFSGREISLGRDFRISPFGNRDAGNTFAQRPHYHRTITGPGGKMVPGGSDKWHRPWEKGW